MYYIFFFLSAMLVSSCVPKRIEIGKRSKKKSALNVRIDTSQVAGQGLGLTEGGEELADWEIEYDCAQSGKGKLIKKTVNTQTFLVDETCKFRLQSFNWGVISKYSRETGQDYWDSESSPYSTTDQAFFVDSGESKGAYAKVLRTVPIIKSEDNNIEYVIGQFVIGQELRNTLQSIKALVNFQSIKQPELKLSKIAPVKSDKGFTVTLHLECTGEMEMESGELPKCGDYSLSDIDAIVSGEPIERTMEGYKKVLGLLGESQKIPDTLQLSFSEIEENKIYFLILGAKKGNNFGFTVLPFSIVVTPAS
ncbi:MAG: hypothetical protein HYW48_05950 [Deltaproteobacteria bacterium]|nr:hypothetical protein [Deltaproteobacteria bacterium]